MNYEQSVEYIHSLLRFGVSPGLERISALLNKLGNPQKRLRFVHVAGTNGKGTTSTFLSQILKSAGLLTGLFTSPYVVDFRERIQVNNEYIGKKELAECTTLVRNVALELKQSNVLPTEFEVITAIALLYFERRGCDIVVLECGMGGEHDSTNVIPSAEVAVFTSISLDHMNMLGSTVEEISREKSGIIKPGCRVVCYPDSNGGLDFHPQDEFAVRSITEKAAKLGCHVTVANGNRLNVISQGLEGSDAYVDGIMVHIPFIGSHQVANALTAVSAARELASLGYPITDECIKLGIENSRLPARLEIMKRKPLTLLDGGHNDGCIEAVCAVLERYLCGRRLVVLAAFMKDKQCDEVLKRLMPYCDAVVFTQPKNPRSCPAHTLAEMAAGLCQEIYAVPDSNSALDKAMSLTKDEDVLLICGSFYLAGEIRGRLL